MFEGYKPKATASENQGTNSFGIALELMDGEDMSFGSGAFHYGDGDAPSTLDELVDMLDIKETLGTVVSHDIQHFSAFASEDKWPI